ncbi:MAG: hypothetical protein KDD69_02870, partial [Bdellovibrionales bacterium]|nr:hypothetical protein [Bdellovibrionales bacterium]
TGTVWGVAPLPDRGDGWRPTQLTLSPQAPLTAVTLRLVSASPPSADNRWVAMLSRVDYLADPAQQTEAERSQTERLRLGVTIILGLTLTVLLARYGAEMPLAAYGLLLFVLIAGVHLRENVFFYWDEWHVLQRYLEMGVRGTLYTHNEHFLPLFFLTYFIESRLFGDAYQSYLWVSFSIHCFNALLVTKLLERFGDNGTHTRTAARLLGAAFAVSALHAEALHWAFEQSLLAAETATLLCLLAALRAVRDGRRRAFAGGAIACGVAPFFFGNGFSVPLQAAVIALFGGVVAADPAAERLLRARRALSYLACCAAALALPALLYSVFREGAGHGISQADPFGNMAALIDYLTVGIGLGTVLRGIGIFPALEPNAASAAASLLAEAVPAFSFVAANPAFRFSLLGLMIAGILLLVGAALDRRSAAAREWSAGLLLCLSTLLLPALGRWSFGVEQSLSLRYHYAALPGLCLMVLPALRGILALPASRVGKTIRAVVMLLFGLHLAAQLEVGARFDYFTSQGEVHHAFVSRLTEWNTRRRQNGAPIPGYEMSGTPWEGLQPPYPQTLTPGRHPDDIARVLHWLHPERHPSLELSK